LVGKKRKEAGEKEVKKKREKRRDIDIIGQREERK